MKENAKDDDVDVDPKKKCTKIPVLFSASFKVISSSTVKSERPFWFTLYAIRCKVGDECDDDSGGDKSARENKEISKRL